MPDLRCRYFLGLFFFLCFNVSQAQQYTIPWATQQPQWVFPIYFEEGTGQRDTIYIGYDPASSSIFYDTIFGEKKIYVDTNLFNVSICDGWLLGPGQIRDSVYKSTASQMIAWSDCADA